MEKTRSQYLIKEILKQQVLTEDDSAYIVYDLDLLEKRFEELKSAFPSDTLHGIAIKSCPLPVMLSKQAKAGLGAEAASIEEVQIALSSGISSDKVIFDGPAKTKNEILFCIKNQIYINIDSFEELERVDDLLAGSTEFKAGLRLNPGLGLGKIGDTSVAGKKSKFGVNLDDHAQRIEEAFKKYSWLVGVHVHIGSQGMSLDELVAGTKKVCQFTQDFKGLERFDLGGGLPVVYKDDDPNVSFKEYTDALRVHIPKLFDGSLKLLTEFGRRVYSDTAIAISSIEYVKEDRQIVAHLGADMFLRRVYKPQDWFHRLTVFNSLGDTISKPEQVYAVAGPLCFGGDFLSREVSLPAVKESDLLVIHDVGAYTLAMWSRHCSRFTPKVIGVKGDNVQICKQRETIDKLIGFWS